MIFLHDNFDNIRNTTITILIKRASYIFYKKQNLLLLRANDSVLSEALLRIIINFWHRQKEKVMKHSNVMLANHAQYLTNDKLYWYLFSWETTSRNYLISKKKKRLFLNSML